MEKITVGRRVYYVLKDGQVRPLDVTNVRGDELGHVNGWLSFDGSNDAGLLPREHADPAGNPMMHLADVRYDASKTPGTWHWPERV